MTAAEKAQAIKDLIWDRMDVEVYIEPSDVEDVTDIDEFERVVDIDRAISEQSEIIYYSRAMEYLSQQDPSLHEACEAAAEYGYETKDLSSEILASILNEKKTREIYWDLRDEIEEILQEDEDEDEEDIEGCGLVSALQAQYDSRASFYGKAQIDDHDDAITLYSYNTKVAEYDKRSGVLKVFGYYSATTARHIREFAKQLGFQLPKGSDIAGEYVR